MRLTASSVGAQARAHNVLAAHSVSMAALSLPSGASSAKHHPTVSSAQQAEKTHIVSQIVSSGPAALQDVSAN
jgi:hypothetical protein